MVKKGAALLSIFVAAVLLTFAARLDAADKFIPIFENDEFQIFLNRSTLRKNNDVVTSSVRYVFTEAGLKTLRAAIPSRERKKEISAEVDFFNYNLVKARYNVQVAALHGADDAPFYREGSKKWLPVKDGTLAAVVVNAMLGELGLQ
ncbi:MAG TPA: hypothetical protein DIC53_00125 [Synergistaceae bacterium]|nr:hypothetical protein [Synergistaceae bacterium]